MDVAIVGEDPVTQNIITRLITDYRPDITIARVLPARGSQIKMLAPKYNKLDSPVILLADLDNEDCAPSLIKKWLGNERLSTKMLFRVACDEAESWLMSDREGFAKWLSVDIGLIPISQPVKKKSEIYELPFSYKPSLFMMRELAVKSTKKKLKEELTPREGASKGPGYNMAMQPFIENIWDVENAAKNSNSLYRAINRIKTFKP